MSFSQFLYQLILSPIILVLEAVYSFSFYYLRNCGAAIIPLSLAVNFLLLPFYKRADQIQNEEQERQKQMAPFIEHIKKTFNGDERYMMTQAFYRENHYKPIYALRSTVALVLEIPFFIAAYNFLSNLSVLKGASFLFLHDLGRPDAILTIGSLTINILPIAMTVINIISSEIYTHGLKLKDKLQLHGMALIFLVFLYNSPSGLVFYWTLNNLFSLFKNIIYQFRKSSKNTPKPNVRLTEHEGILFLGGGILLSSLSGLLIPSAVIQSSPSEFILFSSSTSPVLYIGYSTLTALGTFVLWGGLFYRLASPQGKHISTIAIWAFAITGVVNYIFYGKNTNSLTKELDFDVAQDLSLTSQLINLLISLALILSVILIFKRNKEKIIRFLSPVLILAITFMGGYNIYQIQKSMPNIRRVIAESQKERPNLSFSKDGKNVVVFMLDRAIASYVPYIFQERPDLAAQFDGFTWYPNTLSYGIRTLTGAPALFGGYDYTPMNTNKRTDLSLREKHNEALLTMPLIFHDAGYDVTVCDPPFANYSEIPDLSIYDEYPFIKSYNTEWGMFRSAGEFDDEMLKVWKRSFYCYGLMKICPLICQPTLYAKGSYLSPEYVSNLLNTNSNPSRFHVSYALMDLYLNSYTALTALPEITTSDNTQNAFFLMQNCAAHNVIPLQEPNYVPVFDVDNTEYDQAHTDRFFYNDIPLPTDTVYRMAFYHGNMAALIQLGNWMDKLKELGVYDNTRIIIVSDHGWPMEQFDNLIFGDGSSTDTLYNPEDAMGYNPVLLVKDFGESGEVVFDYTFMTNADTPYLALNGIVDDPLSPFTGNPLFRQYEKDAEKIYVLYSDNWSPYSNSGNTYTDITWYSLSHQNLFTKDNWQKESDEPDN